MKKITLLFIFLFSLFTLHLSARTLTADEALSRVNGWKAPVQLGAGTKSHKPGQSSPLGGIRGGLLLTQTLDEAYVFSATSGAGFIVAAANDELPAVLAYVPAGKYEADNMPPAFNAWLKEVTQSKGVVALPQAGGEAGERLVSEDTSYLLGDIAWTQEAPMNNLCPKYGFEGYNYPTYAGCAPIAIAQIMRYYKHPAKGKGSVSYNTDSYFLDVQTDMGSHTYDWDHILANYLYTSPTETDRQAVAQFVYDVAAACHTDFGPGGSSTEDCRAAMALKYDFGYDASLQLLDHANYTTGEWASIIAAEIDARRPVYVSGVNIGANNRTQGHAFVVDGYDSRGYFHVNWGWNGMSNGYFLLTDLTPGNQGAGGSAAGYAFMQNAIIGIMPDKGGAESPATLRLIYDQIWSEKDENGTSINFYIANPSATDFTGLMALRITSPDGTVLNKPEETAFQTSCSAGRGGERGWYVDLAALGNAPGLRFEVIYQRKGESEWIVAGSRTGSPHSLITYQKAGGSIDLRTDPDETFQMRLADLTADGTLLAGKTVTFRAKVKNTSRYEYFAPLYLMVYDADGALIGYSDYQLCLVPAEGQADVSFTYALPAEKGDYHFCVAYETLGYNYDYSPMLRTDETTYDYLLAVTDKDTPNPPTPPSPDVPDGTDLPYVLTCTDYGTGSVRRDVTVRFQNGEAYIKGISEEVPDGWAHATIKEDVAEFEVPLLLGSHATNYGVQKQYITGASTDTGDVSELTMYYDAETHSFFSYANNWILLTSDPTQVGYYYDHLYSDISIIPSSVAPDDPSVTPPATLTTATYHLTGTNPYTFVPTDYTLQVGFDGDDVYMKGLYPAMPDAWVKGSATDARHYALKTPQFVGNYHGLYNTYVAGVDPATEQLGTLVLGYDASSRTFTSTPDNWFIIQCGEGEATPMMLLDGVIISPYTFVQPDNTLLTPPAGITTSAVDYNFIGTDADDNSTVDHTVSVAVSGSDVYIYGLSVQLPGTWAHGTIGQGGIVRFPRNQYFGTLEGYNIYLGGGDIMSGEMLYGDFLLAYDRATGIFTQPDVNYLAINADPTRVFHLELYKDVRLTPLDPSGIDAQPSTANSQLSTTYDLTGRAVKPTRGLYIRNGRTIIK